MKRFETYLFITALLLVLSTSRQEAVAVNRNVQVKVLNDIALCNSTEKIFNFKIDIGTVAVADSFVGYDLWMKYDPKLVRIITMLPMNSFTEIFQSINPYYVGFSLGRYKDSTLDGSFRAFGMMTGKKVVYGNRHLVAFQAMYIGPDSLGMSSPIEFEYIDFLDAKSFKNQEIVYQGGSVKVETGDISQTKFSIVSNDEYKLDQAKTCDLNVGYKLINTKDLDKISFTIESPKPEIFTVSIPENIENSDLEITSIETIEQSPKQIVKVNAKIKEFNTNSLFTVNVDLKNEITDSVEIKITPLVEDQCDCIGIVEGKTIKVINTYPPISVDEKNGNYTISGNKIYLNDSHKVKEIEIIDLNGRILKNITVTNEKLIVLNEINNGIYFVKTKLIDDKFEIKKIIINN